MAPATIGESFRSFFDAVDEFVSNLASVRLGPLVLALLLFTAYLTLRARASFNILRAAYPNERIQFREIWGAYFAGYGFNAVIPARGGDVVRLFLTKTAVPNSSYPAVAATFVVELMPAAIKQDFSNRVGLMMGLYTTTMSLGAALAAGLTVPLQTITGGGCAVPPCAMGHPPVLAFVIWVPQMVQPRAHRAG